ncbi:glycosyltransferase family A protein, partial [Microbacterium indicum]|uniref:glycosyltransferase family A protein n=1 Tax=Microbacterium indicum TaxID=358100 RepID=UPI0012EBB14E
MSNAQENRFVRLWDSNDLVSRVFRCDELRSAELPEPTAPHEVFDARAKSPLEVSLNTPSLTLIAADAERHESLSVRRSAKISERHLQGFGARNMSTWALDALADRASGGLHDWASLRSVAVRFDENPVGFDAALDRIKIGDIWRIVELIHARTMDTDAERGLLRFLAARVIAGAKFSDGDLESLIENLLNADLGDEARALFPRLTKDTWIRHAFAIDLEHPRFGGSFDAVLGTLNQAYRRFGLETVSLDGDGATPFAQVTAVGTGAAPQGPLVTIIMTSWSPKPEIFTAVRSLIGQTYCNWELLVADDASDPEYGPILDRVEALDPRIRVIRNAENAGTYVRRNEAIKQARGEFVTVQDSDDWSHPRRLEIQVRDLLASPGRYANVVRAARTTEDLSLVSPRGARLFVSEPSIMFRREAVLEAAGYFDTTRKGADTEFRQRLEIATGTPVAVVGPEAPLELMLADKSSLSGGDFGKSLWTSAARVAYRSSIRRYQTRLRSGEVSGRFDFPQVIRALTAPSQLLYGEDASVDVDVLIIVDAHGTPARHWFIDGVADEIALAEASGMKVALLHSDSATGVKNAGPISEVLQAMIDDHRLVRVLAEDDVRADLVVVRHAGAAQGHVAVRRPIQAKRAVVVEDRAGDDRRGITIAKRDVVDTVRAWLDLEPEWMLAENTPSRPQFLSGVVDGGELRVRIRPTSDQPIAAIRAIGAVTLESAVTADDEGGLSATFSVAEFYSGDLALAAVYDGPEDSRPVRAIRVDGKSLLTDSSAERLIITTSHGALRVLDPTASRDFTTRYLDAGVARASVFRQSLELTVSLGSDTNVTGVYFLREVDGDIRRRGFALREATSDGVPASRPIADVVDVRWRVFGTFATPLGTVEAPLAVDDLTEVAETAEYRVRKLA